MSHFPRKSLIFIVLLSLLSFSTPLYSAGTPTIFSYQGRLADSNGDLLGSSSGTTYYFKFSIWNNATVDSGTRLWPTDAPVSTSLTVRQGVFSVNIGDTSAGFPDTLDYDFNTNSDVYLQVEVSSDNSSFQTLSPRQRISSAPFAKLAGSVSGTGSSSFGTTTPFGTSVVSVEATSTTATALSLRAILNQSANLFQIQDSNTNNLLSINSIGGLFASSTLNVTGATRLYSTLNLFGLATLNQASSTGLSANFAEFGGTATTTFTATGLLGVSSTTPFARLSVNPIAGDSFGFVVGSSTATQLSVSSIGFGTTTLSGLTVSGSATSTSNVGFNLSAGCFSIWGNCIGQSATVYIGSGVTGATAGSILFNGSGGLSQDNANLFWKQNGGALGIGTTTPYYSLTIASSTGAQLSLTDTGGLAQWTVRNAGGNLYLGTTTVAGNATTSISALEIAGSGFGTTTLRGLNISGQATSTSDVGFNLAAGCFSIGGNCIGSGSFSNNVSAGGTGNTSFSDNALIFYNAVTGKLAATSSAPLYVGS